MKNQKGFTLIELLIVVAIIGIIAAIAIPNLLSAIQRGKQKRAMGEVRSLATAAQSYATDTNMYPLQGTYGELNGQPAASDIAPDYMKNIPPSDPWNLSYYYQGTSTGFAVASLGLLGAQDATPDYTSNASITSTGCFECDIIWVGDTFQVVPNGKQKKCV
jgi:type II secretion system protein G